MTLHFSTFYAHVPDEFSAAGFHPKTEASHKRSIKMINMLFGSARAYNPGSRFSILTSASTDLSKVTIPFRRVDVPVERQSLMLDRTVGQRGLVAEMPRDETLLMLDADIIVQADLSHLEAIPFDIAVTWRPERLPINGGFIAARNRDNNRALRFFDDFVRRYRERSAEERQWFGDQIVLRELLPTQLGWGPDMLTKPYDGATIHFLRSIDYNCAPKDAEAETDVERLRKRRLLHFKGDRKAAILDYYEQLRVDHRSVLTPYTIPSQMAEQKAANIGDGFILRSSERLFGKVAKSNVLSPRIAPSPDEQTRMAVGDFIILAGANQLNDQYTIWPG